MSYEMSRVYRDIIEEVTRGVEQDINFVNIEKSVLQELKIDWTRKLKEYTTPSEKETPSQKEKSNYNTNEYKHGKKHEFERNGDRNNTSKYMDNFEGDDEAEIFNDLSISDSEIEESGKNVNYMMCLYEKVTKSKNKWRCTLKQGFLNIGNADFAFSTAHGDLEW